MDSSIGYELDKRCEEFKADLNSKRVKAAIDSALQAYPPDTTKPRPAKLTLNFELLLFARFAFWCL